MAAANLSPLAAREQRLVRDAHSTADSLPSRGYSPASSSTFVGREQQQHRASPATVAGARAQLRIPRPDASASELDAWASRLWSHLDRDQNGTITRKELQDEHFMTVVKEALRHGDGGGGGGSSYSRAMMNMKKAINFCVRKADTNDDDQLSFEEFRSMVCMLHRPEGAFPAYMIFSLFDIDGDGHIDKLEFHEAYRFLLGHNPTTVQFDTEWEKLERVSETEGAFNEKVSLTNYIRWLQSSENPTFREYAPPPKSPSKLKSGASNMTSLSTQLPGSRSLSSTQLAGSRSSVMSWKRKITRGLDPGHINDYLPQGRREYFLRSQSDSQLRRFYEEHKGFEKHLRALDMPEESASGACKLVPKILSSEGGTPLTLPGRHNPGGTMTNFCGEVTLWEDYWVTPLRYRVRDRPGDRPIAERATFSEPDRNRMKPSKRHGPLSVKAIRAARFVAPSDEVFPCRPTVLEAEPW
eukprot:TRINITY_DN569_c1_g1_i1.p1 TRINITY_DN569_c1_g1~~TRINITY_DN569_c1_g1_i1.p1  ORF type:complete len:468 (+),score=88.12 TRINITY_DN569_c1_g1_i1:37-1440(+)